MTRTQLEAQADHSVVAGLFHRVRVMQGRHADACYLASEWQTRQALACLELHNVPSLDAPNR